MLSCKCSILRSPLPGNLHEASPLVLPPLLPTITSTITSITIASAVAGMANANKTHECQHQTSQQEYVHCYPLTTVWFWHWSTMPKILVQFQIQISFLLPCFPPLLSLSHPLLILLFCFIKKNIVQLICTDTKLFTQNRNMLPGNFVIWSQTFKNTQNSHKEAGFYKMSRTRAKNGSSPLQRSIARSSL